MQEDFKNDEDDVASTFADIVWQKGDWWFFPWCDLFHRVFHGFDDLQQNLLKLNVVGGFQTQSQKAKWDDETKEACELCNADDTREHRLLHCPALKDVRDVMVEQCNVLENCRQEWIYLPIPRKHPDASLLRAFFQTVKFPETIVFRQSDCERWKIFTDGSAKFPRHAPARIATWSLCRTFQMALARENRFWIFCFCLNRSFLYSMCVGWESFLVTNPLHVLSFLQFWRLRHMQVLYHLSRSLIFTLMRPMFAGLLRS